ncbi:MAG TPA: hypothetical protein VFE14_03495 [Micromonosporaceae bacterium]|nr:hypothetical protein [Micromonosporaceae bacterium]
MSSPLIDEARKKAAIAWLTVAGSPACGVWCLAVEEALYVVSGPGEQPAPGLATAGEALVTVRGDHGGRIVTWPATVTRVWPGTDEWDTVAPQLAAKRLNASGTADALMARWAAECAISRLSAAGPPVEGGATLPSGSLAAPPLPTPAARRTRNPFRLHRVRPPRP